MLKITRINLKSFDYFMDGAIYLGKQKQKA